MASFDPETGARMPDPAAIARSAAPVNPWDRALTVVWQTAAGLAAVVGLAALLLQPGTETELPQDPGLQGAAAAAAGWLVGLATVAGIAQIAARAAAWRPPS